MREHAYYGDELLEPPAATSQEPACEPLQKHAANHRKYYEIAPHPRRMTCCWHRFLRATGSQKIDLSGSQNGARFGAQNGNQKRFFFGTLTLQNTPDRLGHFRVEVF